MGTCQNCEETEPGWEEGPCPNCGFERPLRPIDVACPGCDTPWTLLREVRASGVINMIGDCMCGCRVDIEVTPEET